MAIPDGYSRGLVRGARVVALVEVDDIVRSAIEAAGSLHAWAASRPDARPLQGRGTAYRVAAADDEWVVRHYRRGGAVARLLGDRYLRIRTPRPLHELAVSTAARERGVRTPAVVAATVHAAGPFYRGDLATLYVTDSADLAAVSFGPGRRAGEELVAAWHAAGELVRDAARAGVHHRDLNLKNVLIRFTTSSPEAWLLDLDRARVRPHSDPSLATAMIARLHRSRRKLEALHQAALDHVAIRAFDEALRG